MKKVFVFLLYECVHLPYNFFTFSSVCYQSSFCNRVMISCSIHAVDELYSCNLCVNHPSCSPNFVFSKDSFLVCNSTLFSDVLTWDCCRRCCFSRRPGFTCIVKATVSRCTLGDSSSFQRCSSLVSLTRDIPRQAVKIRNTDYRSSLLLAQQ